MKTGGFVKTPCLCVIVSKLGTILTIAKLLSLNLWLNFTELNKHDNPISTGETFAKLV